MSFGCKLQLGCVLFVLVYIHQSDSEPRPNWRGRQGRCPDTGFVGCAIKCRYDGDCPGNLLCCSNGCGSQCLRPLTVQQVQKLLESTQSRLIGSCPRNNAPDAEPCVEGCRVNSDCYPGQICCAFGCGYLCMQPTLSFMTNEGECPANFPRRSCFDVCKKDEDCGPGFKCCYNGCANQCVVPVSKQKYNGSSGMDRPKGQLGFMGCVGTPCSRGWHCEASMPPCPVSYRCPLRPICVPEGKGCALKSCPPGTICVNQGRLCQKPPCGYTPVCKPAKEDEPLPQRIPFAPSRPQPEKFQPHLELPFTSHQFRPRPFPDRPPHGHASVKDSPPQGHPSFQERPPLGQPSFQDSPPHGHPSFKDSPLHGQPSFQNSPPHEQPSFKDSPPQGHPSFHERPPLGQPSFQDSPPHGHPFFKDSPPHGHPSFKDSPPHGHPSFKDSPPQGHPSFHERPPLGQPSFQNSPPHGHPSFKDSPPHGHPSFKDSPPQGHPSFQDSPPHGHPSLKDSPPHGQPSFQDRNSKNYHEGRPLPDTPVDERPLKEKSLPSEHLIDEHLIPEREQEALQLVPPKTSPFYSAFPLSYHETRDADDFGKKAIEDKEEGKEGKAAAPSTTTRRTIKLLEKEKSGKDYNAPPSQPNLEHMSGWTGRRAQFLPFYSRQFRRPPISFTRPIINRKA